MNRLVPKGKDSPNWKGGEYVDAKGATYIYQNGKYIPKHKLLMEQRLGRPLAKNERVIFRDGNKQNFAGENLKLVTVAQINQQSHQKLKRRVQTICENCGKTVERRQSDFTRFNHHFCSWPCQQEWYRTSEFKEQQRKALYSLFAQGKAKQQIAKKTTPLPLTLYCPNCGACAAHIKNGTCTNCNKQVEPIMYKDSTVMLSLKIKEHIKTCLYKTNN